MHNLAHRKRTQIIIARPHRAFLGIMADESAGAVMERK